MAAAEHPELAAAKRERIRLEGEEAEARALVERLRSNSPVNPEAAAARERLTAAQTDVRRTEHVAFLAEAQYGRDEIARARAALRAASAADRNAAQARLDRLVIDKQESVAEARSRLVGARKAAEAAASAPVLREIGPPDLRAAERAQAKVLADFQRARAAERTAELRGPLAVLAERRDDLQRARAERRARSTAVALLAEKARAVERTRGAQSDDSRRAQAELDDARKQLAAAFAAERAAAGNVAGTLGTSLPRDPAGDVARLSARHPLTLFPVRIETRFATGPAGPELRVRIYPDEILASGHDPRITRGEVLAGQAYWTTAWDAAKEPLAWATLAKSIPPQRAAWIVSVLEPTNLPARGGPPPQFPAPYADPSAVAERYATRVEAMLLPDRWLVVCYRGGQEVRRAVSAPVSDPIALTVAGDVPEGELVDISGDGLRLDRDVLWTIDFPRAEAAGMAVRIGGLSAADLEKGFDRVLVVGVKSTLDPQYGAARLSSLFQAHRYDRGLALVPLGTATNNTSGKAAGFPPDEDAATTYARERIGLALTNESDGYRLLRALGLSDAGVAQLAPHLAGADRTEDAVARAMNTALWPTTWGYALEQMMDPELTAAAIDDARRFFVGHVRGRGPLPAFRIGATPYGVLPTASLDRWRSRIEVGSTENTLPAVLRGLRDLWLAAAPDVARAGRTPSDPDKDLIEMLGLDASAREVRVRTALGLDFYRNLFGLLGVPDAGWTDWIARSWWKARALLGRIGYPGLDPRILGLVFDGSAPAFDGPFVAPEPLSETLPLQPNYLAWLSGASVDDLRATVAPQGFEKAPLLYLLLRQAALLTYGGAALDLHQQHSHGTILRREMELVRIVPGTEREPTVFDRLDATIAAVDPAFPVKQYVRTAPARAAMPELQEYQDAMGALAPLPTSELERLLTETIDVCSHRLDAWITSLASKRLAELRAEEGGTYLGAFAWVENLRRSPASRRPPRALRDGRVLARQVDSGGHVQAPSLVHAAAAAVLRNAYLTHSVASAARYAIDLSSSRVRRALWLLDAVRSGQPLAAVFGYLVERGLDDANLQVYKEPLRQLYPMPGLIDPPANAPAESIAARDVVNGWKLYEAPDPFGGLSIAAGDRANLDAIVSQLREAADAVADLLTADAVFHIVSGGTSSAAASLDALSKGARPPEPEIAHTPRGGTALTHRIAITLNAQAAANVPNWSATERATVEPALNAWLAPMFGNPADVRCRTTYLAPQPGDPEHREPLEVRLSQLGLAPIDVLALARAVESGAAASELDRRIGWFVLATAPEDSNVEITYDADPAWDRNTVRSFPEILELTRALDAMLGSARPMTPEDLALPEDAWAIQDADRRLPDAVGRADAARQALVGARTALFTAQSDVLSGAAANLDALRDALIGAAEFGIPGAVPVSRKGTTAALQKALLAQAKSVLKDVDDRLARDAQQTDPAERVSTLFAGTVKFVPAFDVVGGAELTQALGTAATLVRGAFEPPKWFQRAARVRAGAARLRRVALYGGALGTPLPGFEIAQLPYVADARWVALPFPSEDERPPSGRVSIALVRRTQRPVNVPWAGLFVDEWTETIPLASEETGVAFHYDDPGAEAAQTVLVAVPPGDAEWWDLPALLATLNETFDLAKIRAVDSDLVGKVSQMLPAIYLAANDGRETIETDFARLRTGDVRIVPWG